MEKHRSKPDLKVLYMATQVKILADKDHAKGTMSNRRIYLKAIAHRLPICLSTFYKYMRMPTDDYQTLMDEYARQQTEKVERELREFNERRRRKRLAAAMSRSETAAPPQPPHTDETPALPAARPLAAAAVDSKSVPAPKKRRKKAQNSVSAEIPPPEMPETPELNRPPHPHATEAEDMPAPQRQPKPAEA